MAHLPNCVKTISTVYLEVGPPFPARFWRPASLSGGRRRAKPRTLPRGRPAANPLSGGHRARQRDGCGASMSRRWRRRLAFILIGPGRGAAGLLVVSWFIWLPDRSGPPVDHRVRRGAVAYP